MLGNERQGARQQCGQQVACEGDVTAADGQRAVVAAFSPLSLAMHARMHVPSVKG
jgi:hypothetical protein